MLGEQSLERGAERIDVRVSAVGRQTVPHGVCASMPTSPRHVVRCPGKRSSWFWRDRSPQSFADREETAEAGSALIVAPGEEFALVADGGPAEAVCIMAVGGQAIADGSAFTPPWAQ